MNARLKKKDIQKNVCKSICYRYESFIFYCSLCISCHFLACFAVTCPTPIHPKQTKIGMQGKRQRLFILQKYPISPKSQKEIPTK